MHKSIEYNEPCRHRAFQQFTQVCCFETGTPLPLQMTQPKYFGCTNFALPFQSLFLTLPCFTLCSMLCKINVPRAVRPDYVLFYLFDTDPYKMEGPVALTPCYCSRFTAVLYRSKYDLNTRSTVPLRHHDQVCFSKLISRWICCVDLTIQLQRISDGHRLLRHSWACNVK